ncbi:MAG: (d)CMP kinase [Actinobacteria bacterium HGW-Actinobacteria-7]|jgi:cytidylate kinase|nr:MAG: (d)CMP kinase [Actinobacteria bacterium HGW-Actinobacteria-7]
MIIAIDGPAGSGKSTVAKLVARRMGFRYLDTGAMYRALAFHALANGVSTSDEDAVVRLATQSEVTFAHEPGDPLPSRVFIAAEDVTAAIRTPSVDDAVSAVARLPRVRAAMLEQQRHLGRDSDIVVEGRDIGTVVFPNAEVKVFLTATPDERARRRVAQQAQSGALVDIADVRESIERRDSADSTREIAPLVAADDAHQLDTTGLSIDEVVERIAQFAEGERA